MRTRAMIGAAAALFCGPAFGQTGPDCSNFQRLDQVAEALASKDTVARLRAQACGLASSDRASRGLVIRQILSGARSLAISIENVDGDQEGAAFLPMMPAFMAKKLEWSDDGLKFKNYNGDAGSLIGDSLTIFFHQRPILSEKGSATAHNCEVTLQLADSRDRLEGILRCQGITHRFRAWLGL